MDSPTAAREESATKKKPEAGISLSILAPGFGLLASFLIASAPISEVLVSCNSDRFLKAISISASTDFGGSLLFVIRIIYLTCCLYRGAVVYRRIAHQTTRWRKAMRNAASLV